MKITPLDIRQQQFGQRLRGCDAKEVHTFMELVASELEALVLENNRLQQHNAMLEQRLMEFRERENILKETLMTAQKMTTDIRNSAHKESEIIVGQAKVQADKIISMANQRLAKLIDDINEMKRQRARLESDIRNTIESHGRLLDVMADGTRREQSPEDKIHVMQNSK